MTDRYLSLLLPIPTKAGETYTYLGDAEIGERVEVHFGHRAVIAYVVGAAEPYEGAKLISKRLDGFSLFSPEIIELTRRMALQTFSPWYRCMETAVPAGLKMSVQAGSRWRRTLVSAKAVATEDERILSAIRMVEDHPASLTITELSRKLDLPRGRIDTLVKNGIFTIEKVRERRSPFREGECVRDKPRILNAEQKIALDKILSGGAPEVLLMGVTGSGKTEVYLQAIEQTIASGRSAIVLVPEISLTPQTVDRFRARFGETVAVLHSALSQGERFDEWLRIKNSEAKVVVGARSAIFAPVTDLGLIVIDEAHESSYKQSDSPRYNALDVARERGGQSGAVVVLGTATPLCEFAWRVKTGRSALALLKKRVEERPLPRTTIVDMREELAEGNRSIFSRALRRALAQTFEQKEQAILFLNRRGHASFILCRTCGEAVKCPRCAVSLTVHGSTRLVCHFCNHRATMAPACPSCGSRSIKAFGAGTERIEAEVAKAFPRQKVVRMDADTTVRKGSHREILSAFAAGEYDVLVGTQMIGKGLDLPNVSLVGVMAADSSLHLPDFRSAERTFYTLVQVTGRAGRETPGRAIIQTYTPDHYAVALSAHHDVEAFLKVELASREKSKLPPYSRILQWTVESEIENDIIDFIGRLADHLRAFPGTVSGPAPAPIERLRNKFRWQVRWIIDPELAHDVLKAAVTGAPQEKRVKCSLDIDPFDLL